MWIPPNQETAIIHPYIANCMIGPFKIINFSARFWAFCTSVALTSNFSISCSPRTNAFTTRIAISVSWMEAFSASYFLNIAEKRGIAFLVITARLIPRTGIATRKMSDNCALIWTAIQVAIMSMTGARTIIRIQLVNAICTVLTSVVRRVISDGVEKWSILAKEKSCILLKTVFRTL